MNLSSTRIMRSEAEILKEDQVIRNEIERKKYYDAARNNNNNFDANAISLNRSGSTRDMDLPVSFRLAFNSNNNNNTNSQQQRQQQGTSVNAIPDKDVDGYTDSGIQTQLILDDLRKNVLADGKEYDSVSLTNIIKAKYPNVTPALIKSVLDTIFSDIENLRGRVAGTVEGFRLLVSARNPNLNSNQGFSKQPMQQNNSQQLQQQNQQTTQQPSTTARQSYIFT